MDIAEDNIDRNYMTQSKLHDNCNHKYLSMICDIKLHSFYSNWSVLCNNL